MGNYKGRVTKGNKSGNADLDSYAGKNTAGAIRNPNQSVSGKKSTGSRAPKTGGNPLSGNLVGKKATQLPSVSKTRNAKGENRTTY